jgi:hypothetical protein
MPADWAGDAGMVTSSTHSYSGANGLALTSGTAGVVYYATYGVADPGDGETVDVTGMVYFDAAASGGAFYAGPTFRCSSAAMDDSSTSCYWARIYFDGFVGNSEFRLSRVVNGTVTDMKTVSSSGQISRGYWYRIRATCAGSDLFNVVLTRMADGYTMNASGTFQSSPASVVSSFSATSIANGAYFGYAASAADTGSKVFMDDISANLGDAAVVPPRAPFVVPIPFQYYHPD